MQNLPHYRQIRNFTIVSESFTPDNGLLTAMGKLRRDAINARFAAEIDSRCTIGAENAMTPAVSAAGQR